MGMVIDGNVKEREAMREFHLGNNEKAEQLQAEFVAEFRAEYEHKDHCPCKTETCRYHGMCKECVAIHRAHKDHVPNCLRPMINKKIRALASLTEHTLNEE